jgi:WD40 repeat protein
MPDKFNLSDIFISYSRRDTEFVKKLDKAFRDAGKEVWIDWEDIPLSADWWAEIKAGIEAAEAFVFVISPDSVQSTICRDEINHALECGKRFVPLLHLDIIEPTHKEAMHSAISTHNWIFCRESDSFDDAFKKLLDTIETDFEHRKVHTRLLIRAKEWQERHGDNSLLLDGNDLAQALNWLQNSTGKSPSPTDNHLSYINSSKQYRQQQRIITLGSFVAIAIFIMLSIGLFVAQRRASNNALIANQNAATAVVAQQEAQLNADYAATQAAIAVDYANIAATQAAIAEQEADENQAVARAISQVSNAQQAFERGDSFGALGFVLDAITIRALPLAQLTLAKIAYSPGAMLWLNRHTSLIIEAASSPNAMLAATASRDDTVILWDMETGAAVHILRGHTADANSVDFSPNGQTLVSVGSDARILLWDVESGAMTEFATLPGSGLDVRYSPDGALIAASVRVVRNDVDNYEVYIYAATNGDLLQIVATGTAAINSIVFTPDNTLLTGMTPDILEWELTLEGVEPTPEATAEVTEEPEAVIPEVEPIRIFTGTVGNITYIEFSPDNTQFLATATNSDIAIWDYATGTLHAQLAAHSDVVHQAAWLPDGKRIFSASRDRSLILWDAVTTEPIVVMSGHINVATAAAVSYDGRRALTGESGGVGIIWDLAVDDLIQHYGTEETRVNAVAYHPTEAIGAAGLEDGRMQFWNLATGELLHESTEGHTNVVYDVMFTTDERYAVSGGGDCRVIIWELASYEPFAFLGEPCGATEGAIGHIGAVYDIDVNADSTTIVSTGVDGDILLWDIATGRETQRINDIAGTRMFTVMFAPDNETLYTTANARLLQVDIASSTIINEFFGDTVNSVDLGISPDGTILITSLLERTIVTWNIATGEQKMVYTGHQAAIWSASFDPTGTRLVSASDDGTVIVWDVATGDVLRRYRYRLPIRNAVFSPDGKHILFGETGIYRIRIMETAELLEWVHNNRIYRLLSCREQGEFITNDACRPPESVPQISAGEQRGYVYLDAPQHWQFTGSAGAKVTILVQADNTSTGAINEATITRSRRLDSTVMLLDPNGEQLAFNDDDDGAGVATTNSGIRDFELPMDGTYTIIVAGYSGVGVGDYTLVLDIAAPTE